MTGDYASIVAILGMAAVTYMTRMLGFYLSDRLAKMPAYVERCLKFVPGTIMVSLIAPQIFNGGKNMLAASIVCVIAALKLNSMAAVMLIGIATISALRYWT